MRNISNFIMTYLQIILNVIILTSLCIIFLVIIFKNTKISGRVFFECTSNKEMSFQGNSLNGKIKNPNIKVAVDLYKCYIELDCEYIKINGITYENKYDKYEGTLTPYPYIDNQYYIELNADDAAKDIYGAN